MKKNIYVICVATILGLIFLYYKSAIDKKIDSSRIHLKYFTNESNDKEDISSEVTEWNRYEVYPVNSEVSDAVWLQTRFQINRIKTWNGKDNMHQQYIIFNRKKGLLLEEITSDVFGGDFDGDGEDEIIVVSTQGYGMVTLCINVLKISKDDLRISNRIHLMYNVRKLQNNKIWISEGQVEKDHLLLKCANKEISIVCTQKQNIIANVGGKQSNVVNEDEIEVENVTDNLKKGFHKNILIK